MSSSFAEALALLPGYLSQHVLLSLSALSLSLAVSLPLAILAVRIAVLRGPLLGLANVVQTIPGLALLALFYPLLLALSLLTRRLFGFGFSAFGFLPALLALALYGVLPILRNTVTGLTGVDPAARQAARGVGMTPRQSLLLVELPLAAPVIMAGIRTATVWVVGTTTLSTPIGQTSLGNYIFTGLQTENWVFVLFGCGAAAMLALTLDMLLALAESGLARRAPIRLAAAGLGLCAVIGASLLPALQTARAAPAIVIGAKNFNEQYILADLIAARLQQAGFATAVKSDLGSSIAFRALTTGDIGLYVDYSGTLWASQMHRTDMPGRQAMLDQMRDWLLKNYHVTLLGSLGFENAYVFAMRADRARALHIESLADLAGRGLKIGGDFEIFSRPEWRAVEKAYGLSFPDRRQYQPDFLYRAVAGGDVDVISAFSTDGRIARYGLKILADPRQALPPYDAVLLLGPAQDAALAAALRPLIGAIDLSTMQRANLLVDREKDRQTPAQAARWLAGQLAN